MIMEANKYIYDTIKILTKEYPTNSAKLSESKDLDNKDCLWGNFSWIVNNNSYFVYVNGDTIRLRVSSSNNSFEVKNELELISKFEGKELADIMSWLYTSLEKHKNRLMKVYDLRTAPIDEPRPMQDMVVGDRMADLV